MTVVYLDSRRRCSVCLCTAAELGVAAEEFAWEAGACEQCREQRARREYWAEPEINPDR